jgi:hypothetical protein
MADRTGDLRREAARLLEAAKAATDPNARAALIEMAAKFHELAASERADFDALVQSFNDAQMLSQRQSEPVIRSSQRQDSRALCKDPDSYICLTGY